MAKSKAKSNKGLKFLVVVLLVIVIAAVYVITALALGKQWNPVKWGKGSAASGAPDTNAAVLAIGSEGEKLTDGSSYAMGRGLTLLTARDNVKKQEYAPAGEITLTATLSNEYINGAFDWSATFPDGTTAANHVSVTPDVTNTAYATLRFLVPFDKQITVTAKLRGTSSEDTCTVDCLKPVNVGGWHAYVSDFDDEVLFSAKIYDYGVGTVKGEFVLDYGRLYLKDEFINTFKNYLNFDIKMSNSFTVKGNIPAPCFTNGTGSNAEEMIGTDTGDVVTYSSFINGFDNYDQAHKEAIYYAWCQAVNYHGYSFFGETNLLLDISFDYMFNGVFVKNYSDSDYPDSCILYGDNYGDGIAPSVTLNKNVAFYGGAQ